MATISPERITQLNGTDFKFIAMPTSIRIAQDPATNVSTIRYEFQEFLTIDDVQQPKTLTGKSGIISRKWDQVNTMQPAPPGALDPNTGTDLSTVSMAGVLRILRELFDDGYVADNP